MTNFNYSVKSAVSWQILYQIVRRYHDQYDLYVYETHPGGKMYDCLTLHYLSFEKEGNRKLLDINLETGNIHYYSTVESPVKRRTRSGNIVEKFLNANDPRVVIDEICMRLQMPFVKSSPLSCGKSIAVGIIAELAKKNIFSREVFSAQMGYIDSSGFDSGFLEELNCFELTKPVLLQDNPLEAYQYFLLYKDYFKEKKVVALVDMTGYVYFPNNSKIDLLKVYNDSKRSLSKLIQEFIE